MDVGSYTHIQHRLCSIAWIGIMKDMDMRCARSWSPNMHAIFWVTKRIHTIDWNREKEITRAKKFQYALWYEIRIFRSLSLSLSLRVCLVVIVLFFLFPTWYIMCRKCVCRQREPCVCVCRVRGLKCPFFRIFIHRTFLLSQTTNTKLIFCLSTLRVVAHSNSEIKSNSKRAKVTEMKREKTFYYYNFM